MARSASYSESRLARVCRYYGLTRAELAALLGVSPALLSQLEAGRRAYTAAVAARLAPFLAPLEAAEVPPEPADTPPPGPFDPRPLARRRAACLHEARNLRWRLRALPCLLFTF
ncbi:helix-turn-helix domain-containing protein, partial [Hymenobacter ruricola]